MVTAQDPAAGGPEWTADGHYLIINGRHWRATDPEIPDYAEVVLRRELMSARRAVGSALKIEDSAAERTARDRVQRAKTALGERGTPWWEQTAAQRRDRWSPLVDCLTAPSGEH